MLHAQCASTSVIGSYPNSAALLQQTMQGPSHAWAPCTLTPTPIPTNRTQVSSPTYPNASHPLTHVGASPLPVRTVQVRPCPPARPHPPERPAPQEWLQQLLLLQQTHVQRTAVQQSAGHACKAPHFQRLSCLASRVRQVPRLLLRHCVMQLHRRARQHELRHYRIADAWQTSRLPCNVPRRQPTQR